MNRIKKLFCAKKTFAFLPIIVGVFLLSAQGAHALDIGSLVHFTWEGLSTPFANLLYNVVLLPLTYFLGWAGNLVNYAIQPGSIIDSNFVQTGWRTMRDLTNMLFILVLLGIALDYILFNSVGVKRALPRLLIIALLINFSLPIAGVVIDFANVFTAFFINRVGGPHFTEQMATRLGLVNIFTVKVGGTYGLISSASLSTASGMTSDALITTLFAIFFTFGTLFMFLALAAMFLIRYFYLSVLLIVLPLVLVTSVIPHLSSHYKNWTDKFFRWTMFAPAASFFLYLSLVFLDSQLNVVNKYMADNSGGFITGTGNEITTFLFAWMLMGMSIVVAQSMGIAGASTAVAMWNKGTKWAKGKAAGATRTSVAAAGRAVGADKQMEKIEKGLQKMGFASLASGVRSVGAKTKMAMKKQEALTAKEKATYEEYSDGGLIAEMQRLEKSKIPGSGAKANQIAMLLSQRKGNALTIKDADGNTDEVATLSLRKTAWDNANALGDKQVMEAVAAKDPRIGLHAIDKKYAGKPQTFKINDKTKADAIISLHKNIRAKDIEELPDPFFASPAGQTLIKDMMDEKAVTLNHLRTAVESSKDSFLAGIKSYITTVGGIGNKGGAGVAPTGLYTKHPGLAHSLESGAGQELIGYVT